jgi:hypothetical protein
VLWHACAATGNAVGHSPQAALANPHFNEKQDSKRGLPMFVKITIAVALILGTASGAMAAPKQKHNTNRTHTYDTRGQHGGSAARVKTTHAKTTHARTAHAKTTHAKIAHAQTADVKITQSQPAQLQTTQSQPTQSKSQPTQSQTTNAKTTDPKTGHAKTAHAKTTRAKITRARIAQKHRAKQAYVSYESRNWSFGSATSGLVMANPKQSSNRYHGLYNTRAQYIGPASRAAATAKLKHSSNPANDVFDIRGWYIGSDPDPIVRFMMMIDPWPSDS